MAEVDGANAQAQRRGRRVAGDLVGPETLFAQERKAHATGSKSPIAVGSFEVRPCQRSAKETICWFSLPLSCWDAEAAHFVGPNRAVPEGAFLLLNGRL